jgi:hypothetical protein
MARVVAKEVNVTNQARAKRGSSGYATRGFRDAMKGQ